MQEESASSQPSSPEQHTLLGNLPPDEMFARGMQSVKMTSGTNGPWQPPSIDECARLFPGYEVLCLLGRGGMGAVYQARQIELDRLVAVKLLPLEVSVDKDFADRFRREARAMAKLNHPNIIAVYDFGTTREGHLFFVMEFVEGANLYDVIHQVGLDGGQALSILEQVCVALAYAHNKGIVHRDIKPANVMIDTESHVKVADFGLARLTDPSVMDLGHTMTGTVMGTPDYMAPEQMKGMNVDHRADIYSLGVMIYEMLCREVPRGIFQPPSLRTGCDTRIDEIVVKAMQQAPDHRYQSTQEMRADVVAARSAVVVPRLANGTPAAAARPPVPPQKFAAPRAPGTPGRPPTPPGKPSPLSPPRPVGKAASPAAPVAKSPLPLYAGIGVGILALVATAFFFRKPKAVHLTKAERYAQEHAAGTAGLPPASGPEPDSTALKLWDTPGKIPKETGITWENDAVHLEGHSLNALAPLSRDAVIRAHVRMNPDARIPQLCLRYDGTKGNERGYTLGLTLENGVHGTVQLQAIENGKYRKLKEWPLPRAFGENEWSLLELRAVGDEVSVSLDGQLLGTVHDSSQPEPGGVHVYAKAGGYFRDIVYVPLDRVVDVPLDPVGHNLAAGPAALEPGAIRLWNSPEKLPAGADCRWEDGAVRIGHGSLGMLHPAYRDATLRARIRLNPDAMNSQIMLRVRPSPGSGPNGSYYLFGVSADHGSLILAANANDQLKELMRWPLPSRTGAEEWMLLELRAVGEELTASADGVVLGIVHDSSVPDPGGAQIFAKANGYFRDVVYVPLDHAARHPGAAGQRPPPGESWKPVTADPAEFDLHYVEVTPQGVRFEQGFLTFKKTCRDGAVRLRALFDAKSKLSSLPLRLRATASRTYNLRLIGESEPKLFLTRLENGVRTDLDLKPVPASVQLGQEVELEFRAVGTHLTGKINGEVIVEADDPTLAEGRGLMGVDRTEPGPVLVKSVEFLILDSPNNATQPPTPPGAKPSGASWHPLFTADDWQKNAPGRSLVDGLIHSQHGYLMKRQSAADGAVRAQVLIRDTNVGVGLVVRQSEAEGSYKLSLGNDSRSIFLWFYPSGSSAGDSLGRFNLPQEPHSGDSITLELRILGNRLSALFNGTTVIQTQDDRAKSAGSWGVMADEGWFSAVDVQP